MGTDARESTENAFEATKALAIRVEQALRHYQHDLAM
jgi:hypothetical protein